MTSTRPARRHRLHLLAASLALVASAPAWSAVTLVAAGTLSGALHDLSGQTGLLENGVAGDLLGGLGSGLAWAGGNTFLALPDRGPNATAWNASIDNTSSYIPRFQTIELTLTPSGGALPYTVSASLTGTTLLSSPTALNYGSAPALNTTGTNYFTGRSDAFGAGVSTNPNNARFDAESIRLSNDGRSVFISDEYGPYIYQFDRATGQRLASIVMPANLAVTNLNKQGSLEISGNTTGRVANKGMEGLALTPDGKTLVGFMQSPLIQDGGDGGRANRIISIDIATGTTKQFAYDNFDAGTSQAYNSSEILALNSHEFLVLERDGKGLGADNSTAFKSVYKLDLNGATDVSALSGESSLLGNAVGKSLFLDIKATLNAAGYTNDQIPAKLEGMSFGADIVVGGVTKHTLYIANDNDFITTTAKGKANPNQWFVFAFTDADLGGSTFDPQVVTSVPEPQSYAMLAAGLLMIGAWRRRQAQRPGR